MFEEAILHRAIEEEFVKKRNFREFSTDLPLVLEQSIAFRHKFSFLHGDAATSSDSCLSNFIVLHPRAVPHFSPNRTPSKEADPPVGSEELAGTEDGATSFIVRHRQAAIGHEEAFFEKLHIDKYIVLYQDF
jgi:hypothetical protein